MLWFPVPKTRLVVQNTPLPDGYKSYLSHPAYIAREAGTQKGFQLVGTDACPGVAWKYGPMRFERYVGDIEPAYDADGPLRLVTWQCVNRNDVPPGWKHTRMVMTTSRTGFAVVDGAQDYHKRWSSHAQRHRKAWLKESLGWEIVPITVDEYIAAYKRSKQDAFLKFLFSNLLREKVRGHGALVTIVGARRTAPHAPTEAGFAFVNVPETHQSIHLMSFHGEAAKAHHVGVGLMDYWFQYAAGHDIRFLEFGNFWTPGEPTSWKGFTRFKAQFGLQFTDYPGPLARWMGRIKNPFVRQR